MHADITKFTEEEKRQHQESIDFVRHNSNKLCEIFADLNKSPATEKPVSIFMAGSPGAGKTEFSKWLKEPFKSMPVRIDPDDVRPHLKHYNGQNSFVVQSAADLAVEKILDFVFAHNQNFILDTTFASYNTAKKNVERSLKHGRKVLVFYVFKKPEIAWAFTKAREKKEGRIVPKEVFIKAFFAARENVNKIKAEFGASVSLNFFTLDFTEKTYDFKANIQSIDDILEFKYNENYLGDILQ